MPRSRLREYYKEKSKAAPTPLRYPFGEARQLNAPDSRSQNQNQNAQQRAQKQERESNQNQSRTPEEPPAKQQRAQQQEREPSQSLTLEEPPAQQTPWVLLLAICTANLTLEYSILVIINVCAAVLSATQLLPIHVAPLPKRRTPACTTAKSTFKMPSGTIITALLGTIHQGTPT